MEGVEKGNKSTEKSLEAKKKARRTVYLVKFKVERNRFGNSCCEMIKNALQGFSGQYW